MDELLQELRQLTFETAQQLEVLSAEDLLEFVERREAIIRRIRLIKPYLDNGGEYRQTVEEVLRFDPFIKKKLEEYKTLAGRELQKISAAKQQRNRYEKDSTGYSDGLFIDRKK
ncbi:hypothetical protein [Paenibacillus sp. GYB003]|uniref:hypothetical protein n=1 Tax=Paenibacillus sp. GYB003 TaxID=2994392 RepID=UPI002F96B698